MRDSEDIKMRRIPACGALAGVALGVAPRVALGVALAMVLTVSVAVAADPPKKDGQPTFGEPGGVTEPRSVDPGDRPGLTFDGTDRGAMADQGAVADQVTSSRLGVAATTQAATGLAEASYEDLVLLVKTARRAFRRKWVGSSEAIARYRPPALEGKTGIVHLTLRRQGAVICESESKEGPILDAAVAAGVLLAQTAREKQLKIPAGGSEYGLEFEWLGSAEYLAEKYTDTFQWSDALLHAFEPAKEGIGVEFRGKRGWTRASEIVTLNYSPDLALQGAETAIGLRHADKMRFAKEIRYFRFAAYHLWQETSRALPVVLVRGETLVPPELGREALDAAIDRLGAYLAYRQNRDGWFSHEYLPSGERYGTGNVARIQMHALAGLAEYARWAGKADLMARVVVGIQKTALFLNPLTVVSVENAAGDEKGKPVAVDSGVVLFFPGHEDYLENTARFLSALLQATPDGSLGSDGLLVSDASLDEKRAGLVQGLLGCQEAGGRLKMEFKPTAGGEAKENLAAVGWGLLALAESSAWKGDERLEQALDKALMYYAPHMATGSKVGDEAGSKASRKTGSTKGGATGDGTGSTMGSSREAAPTPKRAMGPVVLARAFTVGYGLTNDAKASDAAFHVLDYLVTRQVTAAACPWPELHGAINAGSPGVVGVDTAVYLSALADGLLLARQIGDRDRVQRYEAAVVSAARFVLQLEVRPAGCFYIRCQRDALGGVRASLWNNRIRVDHCAAALSGLIRARTALYGPREMATSQPKRD